MVRRALALSLAIVPGCAADAPPLEVGGSTGTGTGSSTTATAASSTTVGAEVSSSSADTGVEPSSTSVAPRFDVPPDLDACAGEGAAVDVVMMTPSGPFAPTHAWWAWDFCCLTEPSLVLAAASQLELINGVITTPHVRVYVPGGWERTEPYLGPRDVALMDVGGGGFGDPVAGFVLVEPLDPDVPTDIATPDLVGTFAIDAQGWTITGSVTAPYCAAMEVPACPCE